MHADVAAGQGKGIQGGVAQGKELEILARLGGGCGQAGAERIQIGGNLDIVDVGRLALTDVAPRSGRPSARTPGASVARKTRVARVRNRIVYMIP
jgi:hypothetical protein